ncbi:MAG: MoxR family ATPase, partial [Oscillospiraceae bacterium]|nr:MoxR family ATPase [Oscillospiraceae bacterium]
AKSIPFVALTSNRTRPLSEALRRRCAYLYIQYPSVEKEVAIIRAKLPDVNEHLAVQAAQAIHNLRESDAILKKPSIAETLDWVSALEALGISDLTPEAASQTLGFVLKSSEDMETGEPILTGKPEQSCGCSHGHGHTHEHGHCGHCAAEQS